VAGRSKPVYVREDALLAAVDLQIGDSATNGAREPANVAAYLRANHLTVTYDRDTITVTSQPIWCPKQRPHPGRITT
jgi:hypothetical protein